MGMSMEIIGFRPPDEKWHLMKAAWDACAIAKIDIPKQVDEFFGNRRPDPEGVMVSIPHREYRAHGDEGFEVGIADIPKQVTILRFYCSW